MTKREELPQIENCDDCGACCMRQGTLPIDWYLGAVAQIGNLGTIPSELRAELGAMHDRFLAEGFPPAGSPCVWYDPETRRCRHYEHRPRLCRDAILPGDFFCRRWRKTMGIDPVERMGFRKGRLVVLNADFSSPAFPAN